MRQLLALQLRLLFRLPPSLIALSQGAIGVLARQHAREAIGEQLQSRQQLGGPYSPAAEAAERQGADDCSLHDKRNDREGADARTLES